MTQALDAVSSAGEPLLGATVRLQLHGSGLENAIAQLQVCESGINPNKFLTPNFSFLTAEGCLLAHFLNF